MINGKLETQNKEPQNGQVVIDEPIPELDEAGWISLQEMDSMFLRTGRKLATDSGHQEMQMKT